MSGTTEAFARVKIDALLSGVLRHFDGIQLGLTATPCTIDADSLPDPEDGRFVRDTLRFFGLEAPTSATRCARRSKPATWCPTASTRR